MVTYLSCRYAPLRRNSTGRWQTLAVWQDHVASVTVFDLLPDTEYEFSVSASRRHRAIDSSFDSVLHSSTVIAKTSAAGITNYLFVILSRKHHVRCSCKTSACFWHRCCKRVYRENNFYSASAWLAEPL